ncbi:MAG: ABC transporter ATP-binding protein [Jatrophihabitantaceae bacterium]
MTDALTLTRLGHRYPGRRWALQDCTVSVPPGRVVALVGPNGAGKTTLLNIAAGLLRPTVGTARVAGEPPDRGLAKIGYVAQDAPLWPRLRVVDVLELGRCTNPGFDMQLAEARIRALEIPARARVHTLSGGQRAQVALTLVLAKRPYLLLLDEPLANLDPLARREFLTSMFASCAEDGVAVLFSSHVIAELERICDYLIVLRAGRVQIAGDIDELRANHRVVTGPPDWPERSGIGVISTSSTAGRATALVRVDSGPLTGPGFEASQPTFDELALGYLAAPLPQTHEVPA